MSTRRRGGRGAEDGEEVGMGNTEESSGIWHRDSRDREEGGCSDVVGVLDTNYPWQARELEEMEREVGMMHHPCMCIHL